MPDQETTFRLNFEDKDIEQVFLNLLTRVEQTENSLRDLAAVQQSTFSDIASNTDKTTKNIKDQTAALDKEKVKISEVGGALKNVAGEINVVGVNLGGVIQKVEEWGEGVRKVIKNLKESSTAGKGLKTVFAGLGGVAVAALASIGAALFKTQAGMDKVAVIGEQIKVTISNIVDRFAKLGQLIIDQGLISGLRNIRSVFSGIGAEIQNDIKVVGQLQTQLTGVRKETIKLNVEESKRRKEIERLKNLSENLSLSESQRLSALRKAVSLENQATDERINLLRQELELKTGLAIANNALFNTATQEELAEIQVQINELDAERFSRLTEIQNKEREVSAQVAEAQKELLDILADANAQLGGPAEIARREYDLAIEKINELKAEAQRLGLTLDFSPLESLAEAQLNAALNRAKGAVEALPSTLKPVFSQNERDFVAEGAKIIESLATGIQKEALKILPEQAEFIKNELFGIFDSFTSIIGTATQTQINAQDRLISQLQRQTDITRSELQEQQSLQQQGYAHSVAALQRQLEEENKLIAQAQERRLQLERKAANQQLLADSVQQASQLTLGATRLAANGAKGGVIGLLTAIGGIGLLFRIIAQAKANAAKFAEVPRFRTGGQVDGERITGPSHEQGGVLIEAEGGEWIINKSASQEHSAFLNLLNSGAFSGMDLSEMVEGANPLPVLVDNLSSQESTLQEIKYRDNVKAMENAYRSAAMEATQELITYFKTRPIDTPLDRPIKREFTEGNVKHKKIIKPK